MSASVPFPDGPATGDSATGDSARKLLERAREARERAYAPYSGFTVGAALLTASGEIFSGCNVENSSYPVSQCAERVALATAVAAGARAFVALAVIGPADDEPCWPCGSCRQALHEFAPELTIISASAGERLEATRLSELLPRAFDLPTKPPPERGGGR